MNASIRKMQINQKKKQSSAFKIVDIVLLYQKQDG